MNRFFRILMCFSFFLLCISGTASAQISGTIPNPNIVIPTPFVMPTPRPINNPSPNIPGMNIPTIVPITIPTHSFPTTVPLKPPNTPFGGKPVATIDLSVFTHVTEITPSPTPRLGKAGYDEGITLFNEEKYYSAWKAFTESRYEDWEDWAAKCPQEKPATGEIWHDPGQRMQNMELTIRVDQSSTDMFFRVYKEGALISNIYIAGSDEVTILLPGNADYSVKDGIGIIWYGEKEAFGKNGTYETMTFDEKGTESVYLQSGYAYTLTINVTDPTGDPEVDSKPESWENFSE